MKFYHCQYTKIKILYVYGYFYSGKYCIFIFMISLLQHIDQLHILVFKLRTLISKIAMQFELHKMFTFLNYILHCIEFKYLKIIQGNRKFYNIYC